MSFFGIDVESIPEQELLAAGSEHDFEICDVKFEENKNGEPMISLRLASLDQPDADVVFERLTIRPNGYPARRLKQFSAAADLGGLAVNNENAAEILQGRIVRARIKHETYEGELRHVIARFLPPAH